MLNVLFNSSLHARSVCEKECAVQAVFFDGHLAVYARIEEEVEV
jgi:hypothetical protein